MKVKKNKNGGNKFHSPILVSRIQMVKVKQKIKAAKGEIPK